MVVTDVSGQEYAMRLLKRKDATPPTPDLIARNIRRRMNIINAIKDIGEYIPKKVTTAKNSIQECLDISNSETLAVRNNPSHGRFLSCANIFLSNNKTSENSSIQTSSNSRSSESHSAFDESHLNTREAIFERSNENKLYPKITAFDFNEMIASADTSLQSFAADAYSAEFELTDDETKSDNFDPEDKVTEIQKKLLPESYRRSTRAIDRLLFNKSAELPDVVSTSSIRLYPDLSDMDAIDSMSGRSNFESSKNYTKVAETDINSNTLDFEDTNNVTYVSEAPYSIETPDIPPRQKWQSSTATFFQNTSNGMGKSELQIQQKADQDFDHFNNSNLSFENEMISELNSYLVNPFETDSPVVVEPLLDDIPHFDHRTMTFSRNRANSNYSATELMSLDESMVLLRTETFSKTEEQKEEKHKKQNTLTKTASICRTLSQRLMKKFRKSITEETKPPEPQELLPKKIIPDLEEIVKKLLEQVDIQQTSIYQANKALTLCRSMKEFAGSSERVEAERILLLSCLRKSACLDDIRRIAALGERFREVYYRERAEVSIKNMSLVLKDPSLRDEIPGVIEWFIIVIRQGLTIWSTKAVACEDLDDPKIDFSESLLLENLNPDFKIEVSVYSLKQANSVLKDEEKYHIPSKDGTISSKMSIITKRRNKVPLFKQREFQCSAIMESSFKLGGKICYTLGDVNEKGPWTLESVPSDSTLEGTLNLSLDFKLKISGTHSGFLDFGEETGGFVSWNRRWCFLEDRTLYFWNYPREQESNPPIHKLDLSSCISRQIEKVERSRCARKRTLLINVIRGKNENDQDSSLVECKSDCTIVSLLLSFDCNSDLMEWQSKLNHIIYALRDWNIIQTPRHLISDL